MCVYVHKICEDKFGGCTKSFPWLGKKVHKKIDTYGHDADDNGIDLYPRSRDDAAPQQDTLTIEFEATEYSIQCLIHIKKFQGCLIRYSISMKFQIRPIFKCNSAKC